MAVKRYGPVRGAGVTITEKQAEKTITPSPYGVTAFAGVLEKGETDKLISTTSKTEFNRMCGSRIPSFYTPDCSEDFWDAGRGSGRLDLVRITDGTERDASITLKTRETTDSTPTVYGIGRWRDSVQLDAKSGGRWAGAYNRRVGDFTGSGDLTETTIDTGLTLLLDEFAGGVLQLTDITGKSYQIVGNTTAGVVTINSDYTLLTDYTTAGTTDDQFILFKDNVDDYGNVKNIATLVKDGGRDPANEWGLEVYWNGVITLDYPDLNMDSNSDNYFLNVINDDTGNYEVTAVSVYSGTTASYARPANQFGVIEAASLAATVLTIQWVQGYNDAGNTGDGTVGTFVAGNSVQKDFFTLECNSITVPGSETWTVTSTNQDHTFTDATTAVAYTLENDYAVGFTITVGATPWAVGDKIYLIVEPLVTDEAIGGKLYYDYGTSPYNFVLITDNDETTVTVNPGSDLTVLTAVDNLYRLEFAEGMTKGYDGSAGVVDSDYIAAYDLSTSYFNQMKNKQLGLIKHCVPGITSSAVQAAARNYAATNNAMYRAQFASNVTTEQGAVDFVESTLGRNDFMVEIFPSWYYIQDPDANSLKLIPNCGATMGIEAYYAYIYQGYHKAAAGTAAVFEKAVKLPTGDRVLSHEILNPHGIQMVDKKEGNYVIWGDRVSATSTGLFFKHKREQLSHYERVLFENFDYIIFALNNKETWADLRSVLTAYFLPEWQPKGALIGDTFSDAAQIKIDSEINTTATMAAGDLNAEITLRIVDTVERFNIVIGTAGISEDVV